MVAAHLRTAFYLNVDEELRLHGALPGEPSRAAKTARARAVAQLARTLVPETASVYEPGMDARGLTVVCFVPTERARARVARDGGRAARSPADDVLRRVLRRDFAYLHELPDSFVGDPDGALAHLARMDGRPMRVKRAFGFAGMGHRTVRSLDEATRRFVRASPTTLVVEPEVAIEVEFSVHGHLARNGDVVLGRPCVLDSDARGRFARARLAEAEDLGEDERDALGAAAARAAESLAEAAYHGPFGVDAYRATLDGQRLFRSSSEVNARYTMAWGLGMGRKRPDLTFDMDA